MFKLNSTRTLIVVALLAVFLVPSIWYVSVGRKPPDVRLRPDDQQTVALGKRIYGQYCASCHGANLEGQPDWQTRKPDGRLPAPPHDNTGHTWHHSDAMLVDLTANGVQKYAGDDYKSDMPAFAGMLTDGEIIAALSYIKSRWSQEIKASQDSVNRQARE